MSAENIVIYHVKPPIGHRHDLCGQASLFHIYLILTLLTSVLVLITGKINRFLIVSESTSRHFQKVKALPKNLRERL